MAGDRDGGSFFALGEDPEEQLGAALVEFHVAELVEAEQFNVAVAGDGSGELTFASCFDELVDELRGQGVVNTIWTTETPPKTSNAS